MQILHPIYVFVGTVINYILLAFWKVRDKINSPETDAVLFVAHPDDDSLFFHTFIKEYKPYVCLMTTGWSMRRIPDFFKCMKNYGVKYRIYPLDSRDKRINRLQKQVTDVLKIADFKIIATHNSEGEYGHEEHQRVHEAVFKVLPKDSTVFCPVLKKNLLQYPLPDKIVREKMEIFSDVYVTESWVPYDEPAGTPPWVNHEHLEKETV